MLLRKTFFAYVLMLLMPVAIQAESLLPEPPKAKQNYNDTTICAEPIDEMRKDHMSFILHQRDDALRKGKRNKQHSLKECISCHNAPGKDGKVASIKDKDHFCTTCHVYTAVKIDCFKCHSDKPENTQYRHKASAQSFNHHQFASQDLKPETIKTLVTEKEGQQ